MKTFKKYLEEAKFKLTPGWFSPKKVTVWAYYSASEYPKHDNTVEKLGNKIMGRESDGSGIGWGERDFSWSGIDPEKASAFKKELESRKIKGCHVDIDIDDMDDPPEPNQNNMPGSGKKKKK